MLDNTKSRQELDRLREQLVEAWAKTPFPVDEVAIINKKLKEVLEVSGLVPVKTDSRRSRYFQKVERSPEEIAARDADILAYSRNYAKARVAGARSANEARAMGFELPRRKRQGVWKQGV